MNIFLLEMKAVGTNLTERDVMTKRYTGINFH